MYSPRVNDMSSFTIRIVGNKDAMTASIKCKQLQEQTLYVLTLYIYYAL